jgi:hypothetical protein
MSLTSGNFTAPIAPDLAKEVESQIITIAAGAGVAQVSNPAQPQQGFTAYNVSNNLIRGTVVFTAGIVAAGGAATRTFLIPAGGTLSQDYADESMTDSATGAIGAIDSISFVPVTVPAAPGVAESSTLAVAAAATGGYIAIDYMSA